MLATGWSLPLAPPELARLQRYAVAERYSVLLAATVDDEDLEALVVMATQAAVWLEMELSRAS